MQIIFNKGKRNISTESGLLKAGGILEMPAKEASKIKKMYPRDVSEQTSVNGLTMSQEKEIKELKESLEKAKGEIEDLNIMLDESINKNKDLDNELSKLKSK